MDIPIVYSNILEVSEHCGVIQNSRYIPKQYLKQECVLSSLSLIYYF